jgi:Zn finger protein HypA/HybF involved in hydrogenase expression
MQTGEAKLDVGSNEVVCEHCGNPISNITEITKRTLKSLGQVVRNKSKKPFQAFCKTCNENVSFTLDEGKTFCKKCKSALQLSPHFLRSFELYGDKEEK